MRYGGAYKSYGPQYVRGIQEMDGNPPGSDMWVTYSMNKEDMWVSKIPVPVRETVTTQVDDVLGRNTLDQWNIYSPLWCSVQIGMADNGGPALIMKDSDPFDYAKAERVFPVSKKISIEFSIKPTQQDHGSLDIELADAKGTACVRMTLDST